MQKLWIILISINLLNNDCIAQIDSDTTRDIYSWNFYEYLDSSGLHEDALTWLLGDPDDMKDNALNDKINFEISKHYYARNQLGLAHTYLKKISAFTDTSMLNFAIGIAFLVSDTGMISAYIDRYPYLLTNEDTKTTALMLKMLKREKINECDIVRNSENSALTQITMNYLLHKKKSPLLAGLLSAIVPGLGKLYLGYKYQAISAFTINLALGAVLVESFYKSTGILRWVIPLPLAAIFYSGNILGSVLIAIKREIDFQNDIHESIRVYYRNKLLYSK